MHTFGLRRLLLIILVMAGCGLVRSQSYIPAPWQRSLSPVNTYDLDQLELRKSLDQTASRWEAGHPSDGISMLLPLPNGKERKFQIWQSPQMAQELAARFPNIQTYFGQNPADPRQTVYLLQTSRNVKIFYFDQAGMTHIFQPVSPYLALFQFVRPDKDKPAVDLMQACSAQMDEEDNRFDEVTPGQDRRGETKWYRYRLALACTGEYGSYHGTTKEEVLAAMNELLLQVNAVFERELSIHFDLVGNNDQLIFLDPETDPYDNSDIENLLERNKMVCNYTIGYPNFDLGHVLATKFGGQAQIGSICNFSRKAKAFSGLEQPEGYYMGAIFAHELAHQLGAQHTQSNDCNRNLATALEPGSGSTLMAYAGICAPNVQQLPDNYFHGNSLELIAKKAAQGFIFGCVPGTETGNLPPTAEAGPDLYIPIGTPFQLTGKGTDPNGDSLSYLWEQMDALAALDTNNLYGPIFRSQPPATTPVRAIGALNDPWEQLPQHERTATFRLTVRDHHLGLGSTAYDEMTVHFIDSIGPFTLLSPNGGTERWEAGSQQFIEWDEAGTHQAPVSCDTVDIFLSTDGGLTYDMTLASMVPNNGLAQIEVPVVSGQNFKIKVSCSSGYLFDVSDGPFTIFDGSITPPSDTLMTDTTVVMPPDTMNPVMDTTVVVPPDTVTVIDTVITVAEDTIVNPATDTLENPVMDTTITSDPDTLLPPVIDTSTTVPMDTIPDMPADTLVDSPLDTVDTPTMDTIPVIPEDTLSESPIDTIPEVPVDTVSSPATDTTIQQPVDTLVQQPQDTIITQEPPSQGNFPGPGADCKSCYPSISIAPNPTSGLIYWRMKLEKPTLGHFYLLDGLGRVLQNRHLHFPAGDQEIEWDLSLYPSGLYWIHFRTADRAWVKPVVRKR